MILLYILTTRKAWPQCRPQVRRWIDTDYFGGIRRTTDAFPSFFDSAFTLCYEQYLLERLPLLAICQPVARHAGGPKVRSESANTASAIASSSGRDAGRSGPSCTCASSPVPCNSR